jgi:shikimate dehydrogenase
MDQVDFISGKTRIYGIVGHPIEQVRSPEMITAEFLRRSRDAILIPIHVLPEDFSVCVPQLMRVRNLDGLTVTVPFKQLACTLADELGTQARIVGAVNALTRRADGAWVGDIFDGLGCVEAFRRRGYSFKGLRIMLIGAGGAGSAIAVAIAHEGPATIRIFDVDPARAAGLAERVGVVDAKIEVSCGQPTVEGIDILLNASPVGMLDDSRVPIDVSRIPSNVIVFDAIVKPEATKLLGIAQSSGCRIVYGREMMRGQIAKVVDFFDAGLRAELPGQR